MTATLHIEHPITDLETWLGAFTRFEEGRRKAGVRAQRIHQPIDDDHYIYISLDFDSVEQAGAFKRFLETNVWTSGDSAPALGGTPKREDPHRGEYHAASFGLNSTPCPAL